MLRKSKQRHYLARKQKQWLQELEAFGVSHDQEELHKLRVTLKKIRAYARFSEACSQSEAMKDVDPMKKMFHQAGVLRDAVAHLHQLGHFLPAPENFIHEQEEIGREASQTFFQHFEDYRKQGERANCRLLTDVRAVRKGRIRDWYAKQLIRISVLLTESGDRLHKARKKIKELMYVLSVLPSKLVKQLRLNRDYLDRLQDAIGKLHDVLIVASLWSGKELAGSEVVARECDQKEAVVRGLAGDFYRKVHLD